MNIDDIVKILDAISRLLAVVIWPAILLFILIRFREAFKVFLIVLANFPLRAADLRRLRRRKFKPQQA